jgi:hypothetical protein
VQGLTYQSAAIEGRATADKAAADDLRRVLDGAQGALDAAIADLRAQLGEQ